MIKPRRPSRSRRQSAFGIRAPRLTAWAEHHGEVALETLRRLGQKPVATLMTAAAVAIALALPTALVLVLENVKTLGGDWQRSPAVSVFLETEIDEAQAARLSQRILQRREITAADLISRADGLAEFRAYSGLGGALDQLTENPLPVVLELEVRPTALDTDSLTALLAALETLPEVAFVREDAQWVQRFQTILSLLRGAVGLLSVLLGLGVLLVVGNTIRLEIENRRSEIRILCLVGATAGFARRRFLYSGAWYGLLGGILAWLLVAAMTWALEGQVRSLAALYHTDLGLKGLGIAEVASLLSASTLLGIIGSWVAVGRHLGIEDSL